MKQLGLLLACIILLASCRKDLKPAAEPAGLLASEQKIGPGCACTKPTGVVVNSITSTSAAISWTGPLCGTYTLAYRQMPSGAWTFIQNISPGISYLLSGLVPCTQYEVKVSHTGSTCSSIWSTSAFFTTICPYCNSTGVNYSTNNIQYISFMEYSHPSIWVGGAPGTGYTDNTSITLPLQANFTYTMATGLCYNTGLGNGTMRWKLWIDYNNNNVFDASELVVTKTVTNNWSVSVQNCVDMGLPSMTTPNANICPVRARYSVSYNQDQGPCSTITNGHVMDFKVKIGACAAL